MWSPLLHSPMRAAEMAAMPACAGVARKHLLLYSQRSYESYESAAPQQSADSHGASRSSNGWKW